MAAVGNTDFGTDGLITTTLKHYIPTLEDNVFTSKLLLWILKNSGSIQNVAGGRKIVQPLMYAEAPNVGSYSGSDVFQTNDNTGITAAEFPWKQFYGLFSITGLDEAMNSGTEALLSLVDSRLKQLELTMAENFEEMFFGDGSGNAGKDWDGLGAIVDSADPSWGTLGGIDRDTDTWWQASENNLGGALTLAAMATRYNTVSEGEDEPTNIITTQSGHEAYEALLTGNIRYQDTKMADGGFQNLMFKGAPITFSSNTQSGVMYMLNLNYLTLYTLAGTWFKPSDLLTPTNQDAWYKSLLCYGNFVPSNCKRHGKLTGLT